LLVVLWYQKAQKRSIRVITHEHHEQATTAGMQ